MQPQYSPDGGTTWVDVPGGLIQATGKDYAGITANTNPTGILVNLQGVSAANNNPNFQLRLVAAYDPALPLIVDGNNLDPSTTVVNGVTEPGHGSYAKAGFGPQDAQQLLTLGHTPGSFTLTFDGQTTAAINADPNSLTQAQAAANIAAALNALSNIGSGVTVLPYDGYGYEYTIDFGGALADKPQATMTTSDTDANAETGLPGSVQDYVNGTTYGPTAFPSVASGSWQLGNFSFNGDPSNGAPGITTQPVSQTIVGGTPVTFTAAAYSDLGTPSVQWEVSSDNGSSFSPIPGATSTTYTFTTDENLDQTGFEYEAVFTNSGGSTATNPATLTVVAPVAVSITQSPSGASVAVGIVGSQGAEPDPAIFTASAAGSPAPIAQWQISSDNGTTWTNVSVLQSTVSNAAPTTVTVDGQQQLEQTSTLTYVPKSDASEDGDLIRALFSNEVTPDGLGTSPATLVVLPTETKITGWNFDSSVFNGVTYVNNPAPTATTPGLAASAEAVGMTLPYNPQDGATGTDGNGSVAADDITATPGTLNSNFTENTWRVRGGVSSSVGGTPANGWSNFAPEYTQGVQFSSSTAGYNSVYVTMDWYSTTSGIRDGQEQYTLNGKDWINLPNGFVQVPSGDYYGASATGGAIPLVFDLSQVAGVNNNPNFGVRLVSAYDPGLPNVTTPVYGLPAGTSHGQYANAELVSGGASVYNGSKGNWCFDNVQFHAAPIPTWLDPASIATWNPANNTLEVDGPSTIIADPGTDEPQITVSQSAPVPLGVADPNNGIDSDGNPIAGAVASTPAVAAAPATPALLTINPTVPNTAIHVGGITLEDGGSIDVPSVLDTSGGVYTVGQGGLNGTERAQGTNNVLVVGTLDTVSEEALTDNVATLTANNSFKVGDTVEVDGADLEFNGTFAVTAATPTTFSYQITGTNADVPSGTAAPAGATATNQTSAPTFNIDTSSSVSLPISTASVSGSTVTITAVGTFAPGQMVTIASGSPSSGLDGTYQITGLASGGGFTFTDPNTTGSGSVTLGSSPTAMFSSGLNLEDNDMIVHGGNDGNSDFAAVQGLATAGRNAPIDPSTGLPEVGGIEDGTWTGGGLTSSSAANEVAAQGYEYTALGVVQNSELPLGQFSTWTVGNATEPLRADGNDVIVKYTYVGDWALEGAANDDADSIFIVSYDNTTVPYDWAHGSYNGGEVNDDSVSVFDVDYGNGVFKGGNAL